METDILIGCLILIDSRQQLIAVVIRVHRLPFALCCSKLKNLNICIMLTKLTTLGHVEDIEGSRREGG